MDADVSGPPDPSPNPSAESSEPAVTDAQLGLLVELAGGRPALEFAIGDGRVALPLAARGVRVTGIEIEPAQVARLRARPGGEEARIPVVVGDMAVARAPGAGGFGLVYLVFNTIMNLLTQDAQVACFQNAAAHLAPGGHFLVETMVPALRRLPPGDRYVVFDHGPNHVGIDEYDVAAQGLVSHHIDVPNGGEASRSHAPFRYVWPAELDLMARIAGMRLAGRWADWSRAPFTGESPAHVSAWAKADR
jgi:SAM-dependent methyltransferase